MCSSFVKNGIDLLCKGFSASMVGPNAYVIFGMFTHGGVNGLTRVTREYPWGC